MSKLQEKIKADMEANREHITKGGDWFAMQEGDNRVRILTEPQIICEKYKVGICYPGCGYEGTMKYLTWVLDAKDGKIKLMKIPLTVFEAISMNESDEDYGFDGFPMPYDISIKATGAGTKEVKYALNCRPKKDIPVAVITELKKLNSIPEIIEKMKTKQIEKHKADGTWDKQQEENAKLKEQLDVLRDEEMKGREDSEGVDDEYDSSIPVNFNA